VNGYVDLRPVDDRKAIYSVHFYAPHYYTHQGIDSSRVHLKGKLIYPGEMQVLEGSPKIRWDKEKLRKNLAPVRAFQKKHNAKILVGEFGVLRWAPGSAQWLTDAISLFEEYGWSWCYYSYGNWNGWNPSYDPDDVPSNEMNGGKVTDRLRVLIKEGWSRNKL